jgi:hypothetical protein
MDGSAALEEDDNWTGKSQPSRTPQSHIKSLGGISRTERLRDSINTTKILAQLQGCVLGKLELTAQQVASAKILLDRTLPVLIAAEVNVQHVDIPKPKDILNRIQELIQNNPHLLQTIQLQAIECENATIIEDSSVLSNNQE